MKQDHMRYKSTGNYLWER